MKQRNASLRVQTIGSPRTLKLGVDDHGHPVRALKRGSVRSRSGSSLCARFGYSRGIVNMRNGREWLSEDIELIDTEELVLLPRSSGYDAWRRRRRRAAYRGGYHRRDRTSPEDLPRSTDGANGRNDSRYLTLRFRSFCMVGERGSPRIDRAPRARGPNSMRP